MGTRRLTRSRTWCALALGGVLAPMGALFATGSCILADPPPALPTILPQQPQVLTTDPPQGTFTSWPVGLLTFIAQVQVINPTDPVLYAMLEDEGTAGSKLVTPAGTQAQPGDGGVIVVTVSATPSDTNCHTFTLFLDAIEDNNGGWVEFVGTPATVKCTQSLCRTVLWTYQPRGSSGTCPVFDAGGLPAMRDASADTKSNPGD